MRYLAAILITTMVAGLMVGLLPLAILFPEYGDTLLKVQVWSVIVGLVSFALFVITAAWAAWLAQKGASTCTHYTGDFRWKP